MIAKALAMIHKENLRKEALPAFRIGDTVIASAEVIEMIERGYRVRLAVKGEVEGKVCMKGEALVMVPSGKAE